MCLKAKDDQSVGIYSHLTFEVHESQAPRDKMDHFLTRPDQILILHEPACKKYQTKTLQKCQGLYSYLIFPVDMFGSCPGIELHSGSDFDTPQPKCPLVRRSRSLPNGSELRFPIETQTTMMISVNSQTTRTPPTREEGAERSNYNHVPKPS